MTTLYTLAYPRLADHDARWIDDYRRQHDPRWAMVGAHFTLVFGCAGVSEAVFSSQVAAVAGLARPIHFVCRYAMLGHDHLTDKAYLYLVPDEGHSGLLRLHDQLYGGALAGHLRLDVPFIPHITLGVCDERSFAKRLCDALNVQGLEVRGTVDSLVVASLEEGSVRTHECFRLTAD
ncbi:2'-5' RNA ligase family protein [Pseudomonas sp. NCHU5208]|uniref:2'-5' RNA ligase family protein n=1 Tax=unclassified Pseudomonas TaxID=196821 RepID=UPI003F9DBED9